MNAINKSVTAITLRDDCVSLMNDLTKCNERMAKLEANLRDLGHVPTLNAQGNVPQLTDVEYLKDAVVKLTTVISDLQKDEYLAKLDDASIAKQPMVATPHPTRIGRAISRLTRKGEELFA